MKPFAYLVFLFVVWATPLTVAYGQPLPSFWKKNISDVCGTPNIEVCYQIVKQELGEQKKLNQSRDVIGKLKRLCIWQHVLSCFTLGQLALHSEQSSDQPALMSTIALQTACDLNHEPSCHLLDSFLGQQKVVTLDVQAAQDLEKLESLCLEQTAIACEILADTNIKEAGTTNGKQSQINKRAIALYQQACNQGAYASCLRLFDLYADFVEETRDFAKAMALLETLCEAGAVFECETLAFFYLTNQVVAVDPKRAKELLSKACDGFVASACATLSDMNLTGDFDTPVDPDLGYEFRDGACAFGHGQACLNIGFDLETGDGAFDTADPKTAAVFYEIACGLELGAGCAFLGQLKKDGLGVTQSSEDAQSLFGQGCLLEDADSCFKLGLLLQNEANAADRKKAIDLSAAIVAFEKGCALNSSDACTQAGYWLENGTNTGWFNSGKDLDRAISAYHKACKLNSPKGCFNLGLMHETGKARLKKNEGQAHILYKKSCDLGLKEACLN